MILVENIKSISNRIMNNEIKKKKENTLQFDKLNSQMKMNSSGRKVILRRKEMYRWKKLPTFKWVQIVGNSKISIDKICLENRV